MKDYVIIFLSFSLAMLTSCGQNQYSKNVEFFKNTKAYELARAVEKGEIEKIKSMIKNDSTLLKVVNPTTGSNVLILAIQMEQYEAFKTVLELGADPNFINPLTKYSVLMESIKPFGNQFEWRKERQYAELLLKYGANPNYVLEEDFTNEEGNYVMAASPLTRASGLDLSIVKLLISNGANADKRVGGEIPLASAVSSRKFDIIWYFIDTLKVDVHQPMQINDKDTLYIQDYIKLYMPFEEGSESDQQKQKLIKKCKDT